VSEAARNSSDGTSALWFVDVRLCSAALRSLDAGTGLLPAADCTRIEDTTPEVARGPRLTAHRALRAILAFNGHIANRACQACLAISVCRIVATAR
jgi:hypothetical protein